MSQGQMASDRVEGINFGRMREYRLARMKESMAQHGIGTLITWDAWDMRYIAGVYATIPTRWIENQFVVLPRNGGPHVFANTSFSPYAMREEMPWLDGKVFARPTTSKLTFTVEGLEPFMKVVEKIIVDHGLQGETVGLAGTCSELLYVEAFRRRGMVAVDAKKAVFMARKIKSQDEIDCVRIACASAEAAFDDMKRAIRPGVKECELVGIGMNRLYALGADETMEFVCASGPRTNPLHIDFTDRMVRPGDLVAIDVNGNSYMGYKSCYYRTFCCGKANAEQREVYEEARAMMYDSMSYIKAGNTTADVAKGWPESPRHWGYEEWVDVAGYALAHGLGLSLHEFPMFRPWTARQSPDLLEEGMVIAVETWAGRKGGDFGVRLEECVAVTKDGYELLTKYPVDALTECPL